MIALAVGTLGFGIRRHAFSTQLAPAYAWMLWVLSALWVTLGGHFVELAYLNCLRPVLARWPDRILVLVRLGVWLVGGTFLFLGIATSYSFLVYRAWPDRSMLHGALMRGGIVFIAVELVVHTVLALRGRPSFWSRRG